MSLSYVDLASFINGNDSFKFAAQKAIQKGGIVLTLSDSDGFIFVEEGLTAGQLDEIIKLKEALKESQETAKTSDGEEMLRQEFFEYKYKVAQSEEQWRKKLTEAEEKEEALQDQLIKLQTSSEINSHLIVQLKTEVESLQVRLESEGLQCFSQAKSEAFSEIKNIQALGEEAFEKLKESIER